jgi:hypothetical protein
MYHWRPQHQLAHEPIDGLHLLDVTLRRRIAPLTTAADVLRHPPARVAANGIVDLFRSHNSLRRNSRARRSSIPHVASGASTQAQATVAVGIHFRHEHLIARALRGRPAVTRIALTRPFAATPGMLGKPVLAGVDSTSVPAARVGYRLAGGSTPLYPPVE